MHILLERHVCRANFGTKDFFGTTNFLTKNAPKFAPKCLSLYFVGPKNPTKFPPNFPRNFLRKIKKKSPTSFCRGAVRTFCSDCAVLTRHSTVVVVWRSFWVQFLPLNDGQVEMSSFHSKISPVLLGIP